MPTLLQPSKPHADYCSVQLAQIQPGMHLRSPVYDGAEDDTVLLLAAGTQITTSIIERLQSRGVTSIQVHRNDFQRMTGQASDSGAAAAVARAESVRITDGQSCWNITKDSFLHNVCKHRGSGYQPENVQNYIDNYRESTSQVATLFSGLADGDLKSAPQLAAVTSQSLVKIANDLDLFVALGITPEDTHYPYQHSLQTAMLAMSIGTLLGLQQEALIELGIGCLIHDSGMMRIRKDILKSTSQLDRISFLEITKHPLVTFDLIKNLHQVPHGSRLVAYQMHERCNGSGYPRGRKGKQIHPLSKIAAVADVFVALVSPRPHRPGFLPYKAMEHIIQGTKQGLYDPSAVRGLLHTVSLFPIGSYIQLNDGRHGRVIRANGEAYTSPVIELCTPGASQTDHVLNLNDEQGLKIVKALPVLPAYSPPSLNSISDEDHWA